MSEPKLISPLLDGFVMGPPISSHHGVRCCPAMKHNSDNKYIVKIIAVPASQAQLEALLITGAYQNPGEAVEYFRALADGITEEADLLQKVSKQEGFLPYDGYQVVPMGDNNIGYYVYLVSSYKRSLDKFIRRNTDSACADATNLGINLCAALAACRKSGNIYIDLKPTNVFLSDDGEYRIGDLGFVSLDSVSYTALPSKYRGIYCAPEILDPMNTLNNTVDTYALGMILYQLCNHGKLPQELENSAEPYPAPAGGNGQLCAIIMKAIDPNPENRFQDPVQMGQAIAACVSDDVRQYVPSEKNLTYSTSDTQVFSTEAVNAVLANSNEETKVIPTAQINKLNAERSGDTRVIPTSSVRAALSEESQTAGTVSSDTRVIPTPASAERVSGDTKITPPVSIEPKDNTQDQNTETKVLSSISAAPEATVKTIPEKEALDYSDDYDDYEDDPDSDDDYDDVIRSLPAVPKRKRKKIGFKWLIWLLVFAIVGGLGYGGYYYYTNYYLQTIDSMTLSGEQDTITVKVDSKIEPGLLTVTCSDTYGNSQEATLVNGIAEFSGLLPNSQYKVSISISGFHQLVGKTSDVYNTESRTEIVSFTGIAGSEDGSVMLTFTVDGPEPEKWILTYSADGEDEMSTEFTGHTITIRNLAFPKLYTFTLTPSEDIFITGQTTLEFSSTSLIMAKDLSIVACGNGELSVRWDQPADRTVDTWNVRCYSDGGYDQSIETADTRATFTQIDPNFVYYVEVTAAGMTQPARTSITADPITITAFRVDESDSSKLTVDWDFIGGAPDGGWLLMYSLDGTNTQSVVKCSGTSAEISPRIHGAQYRFTIQAADSTSIFGNNHTYNCPEAAVYKDHSYDVARTTAYLLVTPDKENWTGADVSKDDYTDTFKTNDPISILLFCDNRFYIPSDPISILYVIRNEEGQVISSLVSQGTDDWHNLWVAHNTNYAELDLPLAPTTPGSYKLSIYFNGMYVASAQFSIVG